MAQLVKVLDTRYKDLSSDPQNPHKKLGLATEDNSRGSVLSFYHMGSED